MGSLADSTAAVWLWNSNVPTTVEETVHELVHRQVKLRPNARAVDAHDGTWTYLELDEMSNRLAHYLVGLGVRPEDVVPLCFEKSRWAIVGILAVLKAGAAFVFLDPSHPFDRRQYITSEVEAKAIICSPTQSQLFDDSFPPAFILNEQTLHELSRQISAPRTSVKAFNLLYCIFTSGSTGKPKGCLIEHQAFLSGSLRHAERVDIDHSTRILQLASYTFDVSCLEILTALVHGSCICIPNMALMANGPAYFINEYKITWTFMTPSFVKLMAPSMVPTLKTLALGGEPLSKIAVKTWAGHLQLINGYGPSECSVAATGNTKMTPNTDPANIGYPVGGICWIVDAEDHDILLPPNEVGELVIEGPILSRGYIKNQEKTDEAFVQRPAWGPTTATGENRRFYKTGDLAKFLDDGSIYFIGRKDTQVKLRGLRIELGEIEHNISTHPKVHHQVVILPRKGSFANRLVALVSLNDYLIESKRPVETAAFIHKDMHGEEIQAHLASIREGLASKVPDYMVPETWIVLEKFPLLVSGKLDRNFIGTWVAEASTDNELYQQVIGIDFEDAPAKEDTGSIEEQIRSIVSTVLNIPPAATSLSRSFLSLGGDSITAMQVMARCRRSGFAVCVKDILRSKSITELSFCAKVAAESAYSLEEQFDVPFELSPVQRMYFDIAPPKIGNCSQVHFNQSFFLKVERPVDGPNVAKALELVVTQHSMLRVRFAQQNGKWMQVVPSKMEDSFSFEMHDINRAQDAYPIMASTQISLDIQKGPIFAVRLFNTATDGQHLFLVAHHAAIDLVSWRVILRDLEEILTTGLLTAPKPIPFQNWLALQSEQANSTNVASVLPYTIPTPDFDYWGMSSEPNRMCDTQETTIKLDIAQTKELLEGTCHSAFATESIDLLLASLVYSFKQVFSDRAVPAIFREGHGREPWDDELDISGTVGWFTTMYPLYVAIEGDFSVLDVVKRVKDARHSVPANGRPYFASRYLNQAGMDKFGSHDHVELSFDYLGLYQQMERSDALLTQVPGYQAIFEDAGKETPRFALVEITAEVLQGQMQLLFVFNKHMKNQGLIQSWIETCQSCLLSSISLLQNQKLEPTLSDFPLLKLNYEDLDALVNIKLPEIGIVDIARVQSVYPSAPMQHGLLISQSRSEGAYEYNHTLNVETRNPTEILDVKALEMAWHKVVQRHASLRTVFIESVNRTGLYDQVVLKTMDPNIHVQKCKQDEVNKVFDSRDRFSFSPGGALHRFIICHVSPTTAVCKLEVNHAIVDGSSISNLMGDFVLAYDGRISDGPGFAFENYIRHVMERPLHLATDFWKVYLAGASPSFFPLMAHWEDAVDPCRKLETVTIDVGMSHRDLTDFCTLKNVTLVNIFQFAWGLVLKQYIGSKDVCFGFLSSGRDAPLDGIEEGVGAFITMLVSRMILDDNIIMSAAIEKVADDLARTLPNQDCGLAEIHHALKLGSQPLFNTIISFHRETDHEMISDSSIKVQTIKSYDPTEYALSLDVGVTETKIEVALQYWTSDFTSGQAQNIGDTLAKAVRATVQHSEQPIGAVDFVAPSHLHQMGKINSVYPQYLNECVHHAIEAQVVMHPETEAICSYEGGWTYKELDDQATRLAHHLVSLGVGPEVVVPYVFNKSAWAIISILAILKAGGAGVAFDPNHPIDRIEGLIEQTDARIILGSSHTLRLFANTSNIDHVIAVNSQLINSLAAVDGAANASVTPENSCFVVFTSGTTGKPKGIILEHRNLRTCCTSMGEALGFGRNTRTLQFAAYNFDVSLQDILTTLQMGGIICVISDEERMNDLAGGIRRTQATWANLTATRLNNTGEPLNRDVVEKWADHVELHNLYGPAETTVNQTGSVRLSKSSPASNIGPAYGTHVWIVNDQDSNRLVPMGCAGEILIEGPLLARGYLKDPEMTAAFFIENPAWASQFPDSKAILPRRFYKSGDIGALNTDGSITIFGRRDTQVKINGQRFELEEIMYHAQIALPEGFQIVVDAIAIEEHAKSKTIVGFVTNSDFARHKSLPGQATFNIQDGLRRVLKELQGSLAKVLPLYMIPSLFVPIFNIPYTTSGKLDRNQLRTVPARFNKDQISHYMLRSASVDHPQTPMEHLLRTLFGEILSIDPGTISRDDSFFQLGGDSVGGMKLVAAARKHDVSLRVADVFKKPVLSEMATVCEITRGASTGITVPFSLLGVDSMASKNKIIAEAAMHCDLAAANIKDIYPTSALQEGMMALGLKKEGTYIAQKVFRLPSTFDIGKFRSAWAKVIEIEDILRTRIVASSTGTLQVVSNVPIAWHQANNLEAYLGTDQKHAFQYGEELMRLAIVNHEYFIWTAHHAIYDGRSVAMLFEKVAQAYDGNAVAASTPFKAFIGHFNGVSKADNIEFWRSQFTTQGGFPTSYPEVSIGYVPFSKKRISIQGRTSAGLSNNILPSTIKRAAWALTLATYSDSEDIVFAQTLAGRNIALEGVDDVMGPTITTVPVRVLVPKEDITVKRFLENIQDQSVASIDYEHYGLQNIRGISAEADTSVESITNLFVIQSADQGSNSVLDMEVIHRPEENFDTYPLVVLCNLTGADKYTAEAIFDEDIISTEEMQRVLYQFQHFVQELSDNPERTIDQISLLNEYDRSDVISWNAELPPGVDVRIPDLIARNFDSRPNTEAICAWDGTLTYCELDIVTSKIANHLVALGVGPEVKVGLCFDKSIWNVISMFAVMRTGGVCVQLLPDYPMPRMLSILEDIEANVVLVSSQHAGIFEDVVPDILSIDQSFVDELPTSYESFKAPNYDPSAAAFIVFTSGSTGKPKGVILEHRGFCTMAKYQLPKILLHTDSRVLQFAAHTFDICLFESFSPLIKGACVCVPSEYDRMNNLVGAINSLKVDWIIMASTVADTFHPDQVPGLKSLVLGGEPLRTDIHARWAPRVNLFNDYGPAECSILAVMARSLIDTPCSMIGQCQGGRSWVVDKHDHNRLVPIGCVGELLIEGPLLARGYLKNKEKTDAAYVYDPEWASQVSPNPTRLYKTGDLVRYTQDGNIIYLCRKDSQIKIRGLRIELGEIEHHVTTSSLGTQKQAVERIFLNGDTEKATLAAFIVPSLEDIVDDTQEVPPLTTALQSKFLRLRKHITQSLQAYMVPMLYIPLRKMPETQTNKMNRVALKRIGASLTAEQIVQFSLGGEENSSNKQAPSTWMETALQSLWAELLRIDRDTISTDDSFFIMGGDSIKAMRLTSMARNASIKLIVADIFKNPILCDMAAVASIDRKSAEGDIAPFSLVLAEKTLADDAAATCGVPKEAVEDVYPCTPLQEGLMELATQHEGAYTAQRVFRIRKEINIERFKTAWERLIILHPILRTRIVLSKTSGAVQVVLKEGISWAPELELAQYLASDKRVAVKYGGPLVRYALDSKHRHFMWTIHHALYDGHSVNILMNQLETLYNGEQVDISPGYNCFIKLLTEVDGKECKLFWKTQLSQSTASSFPSLPSATYQPSLDTEVTRTIEIVRSCDRGLMLSTILRAAWAIVTGRYMGSEVVAFAATNSGRNAPVQDIEGIVGPTITTVPIQIQINNASTIEHFLSTVQQQSTQMIPFEHAGLQNIYAMAGQKQNLKNLFVIQQPLDDTQKSSILEEVLDKELLRGFHVYAIVVECMLMSENRVDIELQFDHKVLPEASARIILDQFEHVVHQLVSANTSTLLKDIDLVTPAHVKQMIAWNDLVDMQDVENCVHNIFREQAKVRPNAIAVTSWDGEITYKQLDQISGKLASFLVQKGVQPEYLIPMCFDKSIFAVITMVATLKAGGACVHLGRNLPIARMSDVIEQTGASFVLSDNIHAHKFDGIIEAIVVDQALLDSLHSSAKLPFVPTTAPAFVLFTSGSTGQPKGVVVEHGSLCTSSRAHGTNREVGPTTRLLQFAAYTFDVSVADIFTTLQRGGCICMPSEDERINDLPGAINRMQCNYAFLTPTVAGMLDPKSVPTLKRLILGGELLTEDNVRRWAPVVDLIVSYGMTECSIHCVDAVPLTIESDPADLGRPSGCHMWIVDADDHNKLAPFGAVGELVIEGRMVSRGYLNDKAKTDAAFILDPIWSRGTGKTRRMYKTGDLCKYSSKGIICYVSRKDFQVKHHGQRIELGEIEHHLVADTCVSQAVVLLPNAGHLQKRLVAVLSLESLSATLSPETQLALLSGLDKGVANVQISAVRNQLATRVPDYMVPAVWVVVRAMPLTPNNKMDRVTTAKWLVDMDETVYERAAGGDEECSAPATVQQQRLHDILADLLGLSSINMSRSFLALGGDSITAMQLRANGLTAGISLTVRNILTCESISQLALAAEFVGDDAEEESIGKSFPLSAWQQALLSNNTAAQSLLLRLGSVATVPKLIRAIEALIQQHPMLRARFTRDAQGQWSQMVTKEVAASYRFEAHAVTSIADTHNNFSDNLNIESGPLFTVNLFSEEGCSEQVTAFSIHPAIADTTSVRIIVQDLRELLQGNLLTSSKATSLQSVLSKSQSAIQAESPAFNVASWGVSSKNLLASNTVERLITLSSGVTSNLLSASNNALSTQPVDILVAVLAKAWVTVFGRPASIAVKDEARSVRTVGQFNRIRPIPEINNHHFPQILAEAKDSRAAEVLSHSLMKPIPTTVEMLVRSIDYFVVGDDFLQGSELDIPQAVVKVSAIISNGEMTIKFSHSADIANQDSLAAFIKMVEQSVPNVARNLSTMARKPTISDFPLLDLSNPQLAHLEKILADIKVPFNNVEAIVPCTPLQQRMINSQKRNIGSYQSDTAHKIASGTSSPIHIPRLQAAWKAVTARHEALRTIFIPSVSRPANACDQLILKHYDPPTSIIPCTSANLSRAIQTHHTVHHTTPTPHVALTIFQTRSSIYSKLEISHALQDGTSTRIIYHDLALAYNSLLPSSPAPTFRSYVHWLLQQPRAHAFWTQYLAPAPPCLVPRRSNTRSASKGTHILTPIPLAVTAQRIASLSRTHNLTPATLFQAAWALTLSRLTRSRDVLFAYVSANRDVDVEDVAEIVGPVMEVLACRVRVDSEGSVFGFVRGVGEEMVKTMGMGGRGGGVEVVGEKWNSLVSVEYVGEGGYYAAASAGGGGGGGDGVASAGDGVAIGFETLWGTRAPESDVVLGVLVGEMSVEVQLGYWDGVVEEEVASRAVAVYKGVIEELVGGGDLVAKVGRLKALEV
ncbi:amino acid adenylation [Polyplosphaeria fusca]|uniref:Amino acid adenylation n=1 Tax=Polyplosphaeria fusca TaxID=682080 RepID=A0A9P4UTD8_9PLEO|nr:amino acid adenylation [Polyplosphaeria fusca]